MIQHEYYMARTVEQLVIYFLGFLTQGFTTPII